MRVSTTTSSCVYMRVGVLHLHNKHGVDAFCGKRTLSPPPHVVTACCVCLHVCACVYHVCIMCVRERLRFVYVLYSELQLYPEFIINFIRIGDDERLRGL